ncbi:DUF302 domain-containing protein [Methylobacterium nigriterrae]|uniref:DUF302 domain-containing protein n=1 Tax=Methylobacterium nigriterrae TaxID=3127512 RepID=UPI003013217A
MIRPSASISILALMALIAGTAVAADGMNVRASSGTVTETVNRLSAAIEKGGARVVSIVDHAANAQSIGSRLPETRVVIFGNPKLGTPLILKNPDVAIELPQKMLVWRDGEVTKVAYIEPTEMARRYGIDPCDDTIKAMAAAMDRLAGAAARAD